ncbi:cobalt-precorrin-5B (C(1))-methyltransferase CbiD [Pseudodesulfovibrio senegalensis]|uniref:Cobalt-precorrin-5B C(1)-methyltransferase n=1 Tax=Pseudodesulfovibrio senegalensis TaxID=1721087 RepID=A0A6N6N4G5_9BACT|nr:cobalt-precorrin-5B (C(1))-methyltransferase CbiD [Pseudodesulfovibrio senegalensis]KAB1442976.1 cobalt-precorrin-5B (C(1))-methyltransferase [Pseudodesulfovibrio senegalensis]
MSAEKTLRNGYTTGTCAAAAAKAGVHYLLSGQKLPIADTPLPDGNRLGVPIHALESVQFGEAGAEGVRVTVIKDGGDDPDVTHGCEIQAVVSLDCDNDAYGPCVCVHGGRGVGRVTLPGLPVAVGRAAINPAPRQQIEMAVREEVEDLESCRVIVRVEVPQGERIAQKTMNPRLGIVGGISILGTHGIVRPYSHDSWKASIAEALDVARAQGLERVVFTTGRRSERFYAERYPDTPELAMVQAADFFAFSMRAAAERGFAEVRWAMFFGKLVKHAQGLEYTHAKTHPVDFAMLSDSCAQAGIAPELARQAAGANTARQVLESVAHDPARADLLSLLVERAVHAARSFAPTLSVGYAVFDFDASLLLERVP